MARACEDFIKLLRSLGYIRLAPQISIRYIDEFLKFTFLNEFSLF